MWKKQTSIEQLNQLCINSAVSHLGIKFTEKGHNFLEAKLAVNQRTIQPFGMLHGGVSAALAETVASAASLLTCEDHQIPVGTELNINHLQAVNSGDVFAKAVPLHLGQVQQIWQIEITDSHQKCIAIARLTVKLLNNFNKS